MQPRTPVSVPQKIEGLWPRQHAHEQVLRPPRGQCAEGGGGQYACAKAQLDDMEGANQGIEACLAIDSSWRTKIRNEELLVQANFGQHKQQILLLPHIDNALEVSRHSLIPPYTAVLFENEVGKEYKFFDSMRMVNRFVLLVNGPGIAQRGYAVIAENNLLPQLGSGSHCLCEWDADQHVNHGFSDDWGNRDKFLEAAIALSKKRFPHPH